jgi:hypothetical protein
MNYNRTNIFAGWFAFLVAAIVYLLTIPPTTSFWDCGEFIATAYKLEVCHSPGSPLFMIIARIFTLFAFDPSYAALLVNAMSGLASAFTIMFLFWTITHLSKKIFLKQGEITDGNYFAVLGAGFVGAFAYMFTDTFWFSAVEGEVYALSSLFTAVVFWAILKWENIADQPYANRWIILIAYLVGLSIGVHLLNLLAIPAIVFVYYFRRYKTTKLGVLAAATISLVILGSIMYVIIPYTVKMAAFFDRIFVNSFGMPFKSGVIAFAILLIAAVIYGIWYTHKKGKVVLNTLILGVTVILIGYSSYAMTVIRSNANPPMDQNNPEDLFSLLSYLNREQYGDRPLMYGQYYSAPVVDSEDKITYRKSGDKYEKYSNGIKYMYDDRFTTIFPRMYDSDQSHVREYKRWADIKGTPITVAEGDVRVKPTFGENMKFFVDYQIGWMYFRYFMWNFVGRQNDIQGHGEPGNGNWISGFGFTDNRLGDQADLPDHLANHNARNTYYFLPLLLGLIGLFYHYRKHKKDFWVTMMLFILTGIAIVVYLNQYPLQPRERDYAYPGSFYAFAIWIGIGVLALYDLLNKISKEKVAAVIATVVSLIAVPGILGSENWDDHDRSKRYTARDFAYNYLNSCEKDAILFTNGDNDTFPLWYLQEVEEERTDVRIICLPYLSTDWYINQMKRKAYESEPVPFTMDNEKYKTGVRDYLIIRNRPDLFLNERYEIFESEFENSFDNIMSELLDLLKRSDFVKMEESTYEKLANRGGITPVQVASLTKRLAEEKLRTKYNINEKSINEVDKLVDKLLTNLGKKPMPLKEAMDFVASDAMSTKGSSYDGSSRNYLPGKSFVVPVNKPKVIANGTVQPEDTANIVDYITFTIKGRMVVKSDMMILDLLANNDWERPLYFSSVGRGTFGDLSKYAQNEGFAYRIVPVENKTDDLGRINTRLLYDRFFNQFMYRNLNNEDNHLGWTNRRTIGVVGMRRNMGALADQLVKEGQNQKAIETLDKAFEILSVERHALDYLELGMLNTYYQAGDKEKGDALVRKVFDYTLDELDYYLKDDPIIDVGYNQSQQIAVAVMHTVFRTLEQNRRTALIDELQPLVKEMLSKKSIIVDIINEYTDREKQLMNIFFSLQEERVQDWFGSLSNADKQFVAELNELSRQEIKILQLYVSWIKI